MIEKNSSGAMQHMEDNGAFIRSLFCKHSLYHILSLLISTIGPIVCNILAGLWYGEEGLAIVSLCAPLFFLAAFLGFVISGGGSVLAARAIARNEPEETNRIYSAVIVLSTLTGITVFGGLFLLRTPAEALLAGDTGLDLGGFYPGSLLYAFCSIFVYIPLYFLRVTGKNNIGLLLTLVMTILTLTSVPMLKPVMGLSAIAVGQAIGVVGATVLSMCVLAEQLKIVLPRKLYTLPVIITGSPVGLPRLYTFVGIFVLNGLFRNAGGTSAVAVWGVVLMLQRFLSSVSMGFSQTTMPLSGVFHEERDFTSIRQLLKTAYLYGNLITAAVCLLLLGCGNLLCSLFGLETGALHLPLTLNSVYMILNLNAALLAAHYNASGRVFFANLLPFMQDFVLPVLFALALCRSEAGLYAAYPLAYITGFAFLLAGLLRYRRRHPYFHIPFLFDRRLERDARCISFSVGDNPEEAGTASGKVAEFCETQGFPPRTTMMISMAIEEMLIMIVEKCKGRSSFSVSVRLYFLEGTTILRIRNGGVQFDPLAFYLSYEGNDLEESLDVIGIKYVVETADSVCYRRTFGVNNLVVSWEGALL